MEVEFADKDTVGINGGAALDVPAHEDKPQAAKSKVPHKIQRTAL